VISTQVKYLIKLLTTVQTPTILCPLGALKLLGNSEAMSTHGSCCILIHEFNHGQIMQQLLYFEIASELPNTFRIPKGHQIVDACTVVSNYIRYFTCHSC
jgi:hypothetical protein